MKTDYSLKAELYDTYRWHYPEAAIRFACESVNDYKKARIAEYGAGTGILTKDISPYFEQVYAVEPDDNMADILKGKKIKNVDIIRKYSHQTSEIISNSISAIFSAHALHWFDYDKTIREFDRIIDKNRILITFSNSETGSDEFTKYTNDIIKKYTNDTVIAKHKTDSIDKYYSGYHDYYFYFNQTQRFEEYVNGLSSTSFLPDSSLPSIYNEFKKELQKVFDDYTKNGIRISQCTCTLRIGKLASA